MEEICAAATLRMERRRHSQRFASGYISLRHGWSGVSTQVNRGATLMLKWLKRLAEMVIDEKPSMRSRSTVGDG